MFLTEEEQKAYIKENYPEVTDSRINDNYWDIYCPKCKVVRGFDVVERGYTSQGTSSIHGIDFEAPRTIYFHCPVCRTYKMWILFSFSDKVEIGGKTKSVQKFYKVTSIPGEGLEEIDELPKEPPTLRTAYRQAIRAMDANAHVAAAAMFRRALQVITRDILGVPPSNLATELKATVGMEYNGVKITKSFADNAYIVKEAGNQGAHPDRDPDLLEFTQQDAEDLQKIFMELVSDLFVVPEAIKNARENFLKRRKIQHK